jgi:hypothetical protein
MRRFRCKTDSQARATPPPAIRSNAGRPFTARVLLTQIKFAAKLRPVIRPD